jgi:hypothetical protein
MEETAGAEMTTLGVGFLSYSLVTRIGREEKWSIKAWGASG